jgi:hypothetical protein
MPDAAPPPDDFWSLLDEAEEAVERWPEWQRRYLVEPPLVSSDKTTKSDCADFDKNAAPASR